GMGGHSGGEIASKITVQAIEESILSLERSSEKSIQKINLVQFGNFKTYLQHAISLASEKVFAKANEDPKLKGMGTTTVAVLFRGNCAYIANVGDSRVYFLRNNQLSQLTDDHSLVGEQMRAGFLSPTDMRSHRFKNVITRSVGFQQDVEVDLTVQQVQVGDRFLLCSDGLSNMVEDHELQDILIHNAPHEACERLVDVANARGGDDNISVIIAEVKALSNTKSLSEESTIESE
ncbi:MAG: serine/threonine-protein phosphatase, partial [Deltaproteobacteria bacterium]|nr:serine/threonine-protein phosphatase [Deltaproteobacteria bacterium]